MKQKKKKCTCQEPVTAFKNKYYGQFCRWACEIDNFILYRFV